MYDSAKIFPLEGVVQHYSWGGSAFIPALLGKENNPGKPFAEYWMGAHMKAPAVVRQKNRAVGLDQLVKEQPAKVLGSSIAENFGALPYLLKVLDVKDMLSIQVHPDKQRAKDAFEAENREGIPVDASNRNYKDANHKPELMAALSEFWLLHGFKPEAALKQTLDKVPELQYLTSIFEKGGYRNLYRHVMEMEQERVNKELQPLLTRILPLYKKEKLSRTSEDFWAARAAQLYTTNNNIDRGLFSVYFFNVVHLQPGQAVFQDAGVPHAYLEGQNMEIMANSDNVLRGGLTVKHIDVPELMKHVKFEATVPQIIEPKKKGNTAEEIYETPAADFQLSRIPLMPHQSIIIESHSPDIYFVYEGKIEAYEGEERVACRKGGAFIALAGSQVQLKAADKAIVFRASVPR